MKKKWKMKTWMKIVLLFLTLGIVFSYAMFQGGFVSWFLFYSFTPFALYALLVAFYPLSDFKVERTFNGDSYSVGDELKITISLERKFPFPLFFLIIRNDTSFADKGEELILYPWFKRRISVVYTVANLQRGEHFFRDITLKSGDFLGLFLKDQVISDSKTILVYPSYIDMIYRSIESRYEQGASASQIRLQNDSTMVTGVREYQPGDRFTWIDWKSTAKKNEMQTKEFEERQSHDISVILDRIPSKGFESMVKFSASLIRTIIRHGGQIGLYSVGKDHSIFPIRGGEEHQHQLFYHLAKVQPDSGVPVHAILSGDKVFYQQAASIMIVTSALSQPLVDSAHMFTRNTGAVVIFVIKETGDRITNEENALNEQALRNGTYVRFLYEEGFRSALLGVKQR
ncbi:hypothetical protein AN964_18400 [Heyndrickxia shackletonii]|uniref:DUF58 domain-containing protein n=1 Tax=Heyndrickxia shackletonii TaxID=157838 RepID=A0A0Q3TA78_9BACI|nr:DUF58 domain-containing protein [Heyndrickxia shackletonii]KQL51000.1 hypothetical protein AN964_18400 [Heyndrickxia shackletonii]NEZ02346.1 DUF58 domain-containing protein [Heyndrickxia shackletonii]